MSLEDIERKLQEVLDARASKIGKWEVAEIAASGNVSGAVDLGGHFGFLHIVIPTITSAQLELQVSKELSGTYQDLRQDALTDLSTGGFSDTWKLGGWRFIKIQSSAAQTSAVRFEVRGVTY